MKCEILFSGENKKNILKYPLLRILPRVLKTVYLLNAIVDFVDIWTY